MLRAWLSCFQMIINKFLPNFYGRVTEEKKYSAFILPLNSSGGMNCQRVSQQKGQTLLAAYSLKQHLILFEK